jgi:hypothetical protein
MQCLDTDKTLKDNKGQTALDLARGAQPFFELPSWETGEEKDLVKNLFSFFLFTSLPLLCYSAILLFRYSVIPQFRYSAIPQFRNSANWLFGNSAVPPIRIFRIPFGCYSKFLALYSFAGAEQPLRTYQI